MQQRVYFENLAPCSFLVSFQNQCFEIGRAVFSLPGRELRVQSGEATCSVTHSTCEATLWGWMEVSRFLVLWSSPPQETHYLLPDHMGTAALGSSTTSHGKAENVRATALKLASPSYRRGFRASTRCLAQEPPQHPLWRVRSASLCWDSSWLPWARFAPTVRKRPPPGLRPDSLSRSCLPSPPPAAVHRPLPSLGRSSRPWKCAPLLLPCSEGLPVCSPGSHGRSAPTLRLWLSRPGRWELTSLCPWRHQRGSWPCQLFCWTLMAEGPRLQGQASRKTQWSGSHDI